MVIAFVKLVVAVLVWQAHSQACSSQCPPLDEAGSEVSSLCPGDDASLQLAGLTLPICYPAGTPPVQLADYMPTQAPQGPARLFVISNYYIGCNAGRREANVYSYASTVLHERYPNIIFLSSLKGGSAGQCKSWAELFERDGAVALGSLAEVPQPLTVHDESFQLRDVFFTAPYPHPSYVIVDYNGRVRDKFVGPCCGRAGYFDCDTQTALSLNLTLHIKLQSLLDEIGGLYDGHADCFFTEWTSWSECSCNGVQGVNVGERSRTRDILQNPIGHGICESTFESEACECANPVDCIVETWSEWSSCSRHCGSGERYRTRAVRTQAAFGGIACPELTELESCQGAPCQQQCVSLLGQSLEATIVASSQDGLRHPRDVAFSPFPGRHLGNYSEGRSFPTSGLEAWVVNGHGHSVTIIAGVATEMPKAQTRFDRGWFHYMMNVSALSFNMVTNSGRAADRDTVGYFATCQDNNNSYAGLKDANFFQGPTLYSSSPTYKNLVRHDGGECSSADECFFLHADMLHESPACPGIVHDPETKTAYGTVFWAIDGVAGHLVRYDFQQPHGPGLMDHSIASVRRYPEVQIKRGPPGLHQGMVVDAEARVLYVAAAGSGYVHKVFIDSGEYMRTAREDYPVFSSQLPSFEYSIWACVAHEVFASGLSEPSGLALHDRKLFVGEHATGNLVVFDLATGFLMQTYAASVPGLMGLTFSPEGGQLYGVNALTEQLLHFTPKKLCDEVEAPYADSSYEHPASVTAAPSNCSSNVSIPDANLFVQVHTNAGYASNDSSVQNDSVMDSNAASLQNRTDCGFNSSLNFDALLLGGWHCHRCLPDNCATRDDGICLATQWTGYTCDNEMRLTRRPGGDGASPDNFLLDMQNLPDALVLRFNRTYRLVVNAKGSPLYVASNGVAITEAVDVGTLRIQVTAQLPDALMGAEGLFLPILVEGATSTVTQSSTSTMTDTTRTSSTFTEGMETTTHTTTAGSLLYEHIIEGACDIPVVDTETCERAAHELGYEVRGSLGACRAFGGVLSFAAWGPCTSTHACVCLQDEFFTLAYEGSCQTAVTDLHTCKKAARVLGFSDTVREATGACREYLGVVNLAAWGPCSREHGCICQKTVVMTEVEEYQLVSGGSCRAPVIEERACQEAAQRLGFSAPVLGTNLRSNGRCRVYMTPDGTAMPWYARWGPCSPSHACICQKVKAETEMYELITRDKCRAPVTDEESCREAAVELGFSMPMNQKDTDITGECRLYTTSDGTAVPWFSLWGACSPSHACICRKVHQTV